MPENFHLETVDATAATTVLRVRGHLDARSTPTLVDRCRACAESGRNVVLNLAGVTFIASSGIGGLLALSETLSEAGRSLRLAQISTTVESVVNLLNLQAFLNIDSTEGESVDRLAA